MAEANSSKQEAEGSNRRLWRAALKMRVASEAASILVFCAGPAQSAGAPPPAPPLPGWVVSINRIVEYLSSFTPSGTPSTQASNIIYLNLGAIIGGLAASLPAIRLLLARRAERIAADENLRKLAAKKFNEHLKVLASFCNTAGAATIGAAFIVPYIGNHAPLGSEQLGWSVTGVGVMLIGQAGLRFMKSES